MEKGFVLRFAGITCLIAVAAFLVCWIAFQALVAFGVLIALVIIGAAILGAFYLIDRRRIREGPRF